MLIQTLHITFYQFSSSNLFINSNHSFKTAHIQAIFINNGLNLNLVRANTTANLTRYFASDMYSVTCKCVLYLFADPMIYAWLINY